MKSLKTFADNIILVLKFPQNIYDSGIIKGTEELSLEAKIDALFNLQMNTVYCKNCPDELDHFTIFKSF
jgi:hypothetical protein